MKKRIIALGTDHRGFALKEFIKKNPELAEHITWIDCGAYHNKRSDYPEFGVSVVNAMKVGQADLGILLCGTGIGMSIIANRYPGMYAGLVWNTQVARASKEDDNVNILVLPADYLGQKETITIIWAWLNAEFKGGIYKKRIEQIDQLTQE